METIYRDYAPQGVRFYYVYKALAHPETNSYITPFTQAERLMHVKEAERTLDSQIPWLCDVMTNDAKHSLGDAPNSEFLIDPEGRVAARRAWSSPEQLRSDLEQLVGPVEKKTPVADLNWKKLPPPKGAATGIVPRLKVEGRFDALQITPLTSTQPFYVKLRAEADQGLLRSGTGKLYLGFLLDPLYHVHWNNLAAPIRFSVQAPETIEIMPAEGTGPKVEETADMDPREFLVEVKLSEGAVRSEDVPTLRVKVDYYACHDEEAWCKRVVQEYEVRLAVDRDGGWVQARRRPADAAAGRPMPGGRRPQPGTRGPGGTVVQVDVAARTVTMRTPNGMERTVAVDPDAPINHNGRPGTLADLKPGDRLQVQLQRPDTPGSAPTVTRIMARTP